MTIVRPGLRGRRSLFVAPYLLSVERGEVHTGSGRDGFSSGTECEMYEQEIFFCYCECKKKIDAVSSTSSRLLHE